MRATFTDVIETKITLDTDDMKSICDNLAKEFPNENKDNFFRMALDKLIKKYFSGYIWYNDMPICEVEEMCPNIVDKIAEYLDWYIIHYYRAEPKDFKWSE